MQPEVELHDLIRLLEHEVKKMGPATYVLGLRQRSSTTKIVSIIWKIEVVLMSTRDRRRELFSEHVDRGATSFLLREWCRVTIYRNDDEQLQASGKFDELLPALRTIAKRLDTAGNTSTGINRRQIVTTSDLQVQVHALHMGAAYLEELLPENSPVNPNGGRPIISSRWDLMDLRIVRLQVKVIMEYMIGDQSDNGKRLVHALKAWKESYLAKGAPMVTQGLIDSLLEYDVNDRIATVEEAGEATTTGREGTSRQQEKSVCRASSPKESVVMWSLGPQAAAPRGYWLDEKFNEDLHRAMANSLETQSRDRDNQLDLDLDLARQRSLLSIQTTRIQRVDDQGSSKEHGDIKYGQVAEESAPAEQPAEKLEVNVTYESASEPSDDGTDDAEWFEVSYEASGSVTPERVEVEESRDDERVVVDGDGGTAAHMLEFNFLAGKLRADARAAETKKPAMKGQMEEDAALERAILASLASS